MCRLLFINDNNNDMIYRTKDNHSQQRDNYYGLGKLLKPRFEIRGTNYYFMPNRAYFALLHDCLHGYLKSI